VHGGYVKYYGVKDAAPLPTTVDQLISALSDWLTGTVAGALEARGIPAANNLEAEVEGRIAGDDKFFASPP
jgi:hypothetical protein